MNNKILTFALLLGSIPVFGGCASNHYAAALIKSEPAGAEVVDLADDSLIGITPVVAWWKSSEESRRFVNIRLQKNGYRDKTMSFWLNLRHPSREEAVAKPQIVETKLDSTSNRSPE